MGSTLQLVMRMPHFRQLLLAVKSELTPTQGVQLVMHELVRIAERFDSNCTAISLSDLMTTLRNTGRWPDLLYEDTEVVLRDDSGHIYHPSQQQCAFEGYMVILTVVDEALEQMKQTEVQ